MVIKSVNVLSCARLVAAIYGIFGLIFGLVFSFIALTGFSIAAVGGEEGPAWLAAVFGVGAVIALPVFYGVMGYLGGLVGSWVYNRAADVMGGLEIVVE